jgi:hypothetical protein
MNISGMIMLPVNKSTIGYCNPPVVKGSSRLSVITFLPMGIVRIKPFNYVLPMLLHGAQAFLQCPQHRLRYIRSETLFIPGCDDLALAGDTVYAIGNEPISFG